MTSGCALRDLTKPERFASVAKDVALVTIGFAVLGFQRIQVLRRELEQSMPARVH